MDFLRCFSHSLFCAGRMINVEKCKFKKKIRLLSDTYCSACFHFKAKGSVRGCMLNYLQIIPYYLSKDK